MTTLAPRPPSRRAMASPRPVPPPVTTATWLRKSESLNMKSSIIDPPMPAPRLLRLFDHVPEGIFIGAIDGAACYTASANPYLKLMFGLAADTPDAAVQPLAIDRFVDPQARDAFIERLARDGTVRDYLL